MRPGESAPSIPRPLAVAALALLAGGCGADAEAPPSVLFVTIDTLRADHVGAYGHDRPTTPKLDALAERGVVVERMVAQSPWTKPSVASLFTSLLPSQHRVVEKATRNRLAASLVSLPEVLRDAGYRTACFSENPHIGQVTGYDQGFEAHAVRPGFDGDPQWILDRARTWLDRVDGDEPFFLYLQFLDPHGPYDPDPGPRARDQETRTITRLLANILSHA